MYYSMFCFAEKQQEESVVFGQWIFKAYDW